MVKKRIMVDFDGVLHFSNIGTDKGKLGLPIPGGKEAIDKLKDKFEIVIFTCRACQEEYPDVDSMILQVKDWLNKYGIYYDLITSIKLPAELYIDDKAIRFRNNWDKISDFVNKNLRD